MAKRMIKIDLIVFIVILYLVLKTKLCNRNELNCIKAFFIITTAFI